MLATHSLIVHEDKSTFKYLCLSPRYIHIYIYVCVHTHTHTQREMGGEREKEHALGNGKVNVGKC